MRLGVLSYINAMPLTYGLEGGQVPFAGTVVRGEPSWLNAEARAGRLDVTAVSSAEVAACPGNYHVLPGFCLAARGAVQSVRLFSRLPLGELAGRNVAVTSASATSRILLQVLVEGIRPVELRGEPRLDEEVPATLLIGDRALREVPEATHVYDLGELWRATTGRPMVFALWVATRPEHVLRATAALERSRTWGEAHRDLVLEEAARRTGLEVERLVRYFACLDYRLDDEAVEGLREFYRRGARLGLLPSGGEALLAGVAA